MVCLRKVWNCFSTSLIVGAACVVISTPERICVPKGLCVIR